MANKTSKQRTGRRPLNRLVGRWRPIETAPHDPRIIVDLWTPDDGRLTNYRRVNMSKTNIFYEPTQDGLAVVRDATHWMPLPDAPNAPHEPPAPTTR